MSAEDQPTAAGAEGAAEEIDGDEEGAEEAVEDLAAPAEDLKDVAGGRVQCSPSCPTTSFPKERRAGL